MAAGNAEARLTETFRIERENVSMCMGRTKVDTLFEVGVVLFAKNVLVQKSNEVQ